MEQQQQQNRQRTFLLVALILIILTVLVLVGVYFFFFSAEEELPPTDLTPEVTMVDVLIARQPIPRGAEIPFEAILVDQIEEFRMPPNALLNEAQTVGKITKTEIPQGQIILSDFLQDRFDENLNENAAFNIPPGRVMVAFPVNKQSSVAYAIQPNDVVDVLISISFVDLDPEFQTILPNLSSFFLRNERGEPDLSAAIDQGRYTPELDESFPAVVEFPRETQRPRRAAQLTVQRAKVIRLGSWIEEPTPTPAPVPEGQPAPPPPPPPLPDVVSLAVTPQDALVLLWARKEGVNMELALRAAGDENAENSTEAVTLQYMLTRFNLAIPPKIEFGLEGRPETSEFDPNQQAP